MLGTSLTGSTVLGPWPFVLISVAKTSRPGEVRASVASAEDLFARFRILREGGAAWPRAVGSGTVNRM